MNIYKIRLNSNLHASKILSFKKITAYTMTSLSLISILLITIL